MNAASQAVPAAPATADVQPFPSAASLRADHSELLKRHRKAGDQPEFLTEVERFLQRGQATGVYLDSEKDRWDSQSVLDYWTATLYRLGRPTREATLAEFDPSLAPELDDRQCPYCGLSAFQPANQDRFFGRERLVEEMAERLLGRRLLVVSGASGSGKSSLVLAGLLPVLYTGRLLPGSDGWRYYRPLVPGSDPLTNLLQAVKPPDAGPDWTAQQRAALGHDPGHLRTLLQARDDRPAVLVVDQFEEVFTLCNDDAVRTAFVDGLMGLVQGDGPRHTLILTLRSDFEAQIARLPALQALMEDAEVRITPTPLSARDLRRAIEQPATLVGLHFEDGLIDELVREVLGEPAGLPLLQFTLLKLWESRNHNRVTWEAYRRLGGARLALARTADEFYEALLPEDQATVKRILLLLVHPGESLEVLRNRERRDTLVRALGGNAAWVLDRLVEARLLLLTPGETPADEQVEVAHEALVRNWPRLVEWLDQEREHLRQRRRLTAAAELWKAHGAGLLSGDLLREALGYPDLKPLEREFLEASRAAVEQAEREREAARQRELDQARALAQEQHKRAEVERQRAEEQLRLRRMLQWMLAALGLLLVCTVVAAVSAWRQSRAAEKGRQAAEEAKDEAGRAAKEAEHLSNKLVYQQFIRVAGSSTVAPLFRLLLLVKAVNGLGTGKQEALPAGLEGVFQRALQRVLPPQTPTATLPPAEHPVLDINYATFNKDGSLLLTAGADKQVLIWDVERRGERRTLLAHDEPVLAAAFSPAGQVATATKDNAYVWDVSPRRKAATGTDLAFFAQEKAGDRWEPLHTLKGHQGNIYALAFSPDGKLLATGGEDKTARLWDPRTGDEGPTLSGHTGAINDLAFELVSKPGMGRRLATASADGTAQLWDAQTGSRLARLEHGGAVCAVAFSWKRGRLATAASDGSVKVWDVDTGAQLEAWYTGRPYSAGLLSAFKIAFNAEGTQLATWSFSGSPIMWDVASHEELFTTRTTQPGPWTGLAFSPDVSRCAVLHHLHTPATATAAAVDRGQVDVYAFRPFQRPLALALKELERSQFVPHFGDFDLLLHEFFPVNLDFLRKGYEEAHRGNVDAALHEFRKALELPGLDMDLQSHTRRLAAEALAARANELARTADFAGATDFSHKVHELDATLEPDLDKQLRRLAADAWRNKGERLARDGDFPGALAAFLQEQQLQPPTAQGPDPMPKQRAAQLAAKGYLQKGQAKARAGQIGEAAALFAKARDLDPGVLPHEPEEEAGRQAAQWQRTLAEQFAKSGRLEEATQALQKAGAYDTRRKVDAVKEAGRLVAAGHRQRAENLARQGNVDDALVALQRAVEADPALAFEPLREARRLAAPAVRQRGRSLAQRLDLAEATLTLSQAAAFDPGLKIDPEAEARKYAAAALLTRGGRLARAGLVREALTAYADAQKYDPALKVTAAQWNELCRWGCLFGRAAEVLHAGREAVRLAPAEVAYRDSRGLARALTDDGKGALEDFKAYVKGKRGPADRAKVARRQRWIADLEAGRNPFTKEELHKLRQGE